MDTWPRHDPVYHRARTTPDATALIHGQTGCRHTYRDLDGAVARCAERIRGRLDGVATNRPAVAIAAAPAPAFAVALAATWRAGAVAVPVAADAGADQHLDRLAPKLFLEPGGSNGASLAPDCPHLAVEPDFTAAGTKPAADWPSDETVLVLFTSGTTASPKGVRLTPRNLVASAIGSAFRLGVRSDDRWFDCLPPNHMGGLAPLVRAPLYGAAVVLDDGFDADRTATYLARFDATCVSVVPTMLRRLLDTDWTPHHTLRVVLCGGAPTPVALVREAAAAGVPLYPTYGTTETASQIATARPAEVFADPETVGAPLVTADVTLVDPANGNRVDDGTVGEVVVDGPVVAPGYVDTEASTGPFGLHTGDLAVRDEAGRLSMRGRLDDAIQTGGETVHPVRVADTLRELDTVQDAAVVGVPDPEWGERVAALIVAAEEADPTADDVRHRLEGRLARWELPREIAVADALPRTASGTVDRDAVRTAFTD